MIDSWLELLWGIYSICSCHRRILEFLPMAMMLHHPWLVVSQIHKSSGDVSRSIPIVHMYILYNICIYIYICIVCVIDLLTFIPSFNFLGDPHPPWWTVTLKKNMLWPKLFHHDLLRLSDEPLLQAPDLRCSSPVSWFQGVGPPLGWC